MTHTGYIGKLTAYSGHTHMVKVFSHDSYRLHKSKRIAFIMFHNKVVSQQSIWNVGVQG